MSILNGLFYAMSALVTGISTLTLLLMLFANIGLRLGFIRDDDEYSGNVQRFLKNFC